MWCYNSKLINRVSKSNRISSVIKYSNFKYKKVVEFRRVRWFFIVLTLDKVTPNCNLSITKSPDPMDAGFPRNFYFFLGNRWISPSQSPHSILYTVRFGSKQYQFWLFIWELKWNIPSSSFSFFSFDLFFDFFDFDFFESEVDALPFWLFGRWCW